MPETPTPIIAGTRIGHVHLKVADLDRALGFYCGVLGFELMQRMSSGAAFISAGGYHHHIGLNTWESKGGHPPPPGTTGLFHTAILYPTRPALADALHRVIRPAFSSTAPAITASAKRFICATPTRTASSFIGTGRRRNGRAQPDGSLAMFTQPARGLLGSGPPAATGARDRILMVGSASSRACRGRKPRKTHDLAGRGRANQSRCSRKTAAVSCARNRAAMADERHGRRTRR